MILLTSVSTQTKADTRNHFRGMAEAEDQGLTPRELQRLSVRAMKTREVGRIQRTAQEWVGHAWTELLILVLVLLDFSLTMQEVSDAKKIEVQELEAINNPLNIVTGVCNCTVCGP